jgi:uncharacterized lipoprotein YmbA
MTSCRLARRCLIAGLAALPLLAGCNQSPPPRLFTLAAQPGAAAGTTTRIRLVVKPVEVAKYLDRPEIVRYADPYELRFADLERWGEGLRDMATRILIEDLSLRMPDSQIVSESSPVNLTADATIEVDISRFDADPSGQVFLDVRWALHHGERPAVVHLEHIRVRPNSSSTTDLVAAMSQALGQLSDQIALGVTA